ncbi:hypothetical protein GH714_037638 [Hevea brasiliensis]|uniref:Reverse transcriptase Ty1/copia-type domain-containing protein n=1 Tax=Hevea brasiliensis TaxID=3981 RepID=A0A6A6L7X5_HEVBR|nr:hypothetical protein GH714_037638 [Hevea brasiliensis]
MDQCKSVAAPLVVNEKLSKNDGIEKAEAIEYRSLIGSLLYLTTTRPDLMYSTSLLSRCEDLKLEGYVDSDWAGCMDDMRSTSGCVFSLGSGPFSWNSKKQEVVAQSTAEAEYISAAANQSIWLRKLLNDLANEQVEPTVIWCDNKSVIAIASNPI